MEFRNQIMPQEDMEQKTKQDNMVQIAQVLKVPVDYLVGNLEEKSDAINNIELLFHMNSKELTDEERKV